MAATAQNGEPWLNMGYYAEINGHTAMIKSDKNDRSSKNNFNRQSKILASITRFSLILITPLVFALATSPVRAQSGALAECAACHGEDGIGKDVEIPNLAGQHEVYLYRQLQHFKSGKRTHKEMRYESRQLSDADMQALAHYYAQLPR
jgi:cytochrome c553